MPHFKKSEESYDSDRYPDGFLEPYLSMALLVIVLSLVAVGGLYLTKLVQWLLT